MIIKKLNDMIKFKRQNKRSWERNTDYWLNNPLRQVEDTKSFFKSKLETLIKPDMVIVDMGCGSGWLLDDILELDIPFKYIGLDFNAKFIEHLRIKYSHLNYVTFDLIDIEEILPDKYINCADVVFNCFNFFEVANLEVAFANAVNVLINGGKIVILTIEYTYLMLALSHSMDEFKNFLKTYEEFKSVGDVPYFFQSIDLGNSESKDLKYASVLYSFEDFYKQAIKHNMTLSDYGEVVKTSKYLPKTYQYIVYKK